MTKLIDLQPRFFNSGNLKGAGINFNCPCGKDNCGRILGVVFKNPIDGPIQKHGWERIGNTFKTLTVTPSIKHLYGCQWHGYLTNGIFKEC